MIEKYVTIGIAGHVDHGKTSLVKCLTNIDTDRLQEEKKRGLTIESGVAPFYMSGLNIQIAFVDVPGHIDFLKNTIRGLCCVDMAILVVAADDGVMPQTLEHIHILDYLGVKDGFIVLSKIDRADEDILYLAELEIREVLEGTFLNDKPIIPFSAIDKSGLHEIKQCIAETTKTIQAKDSSLPFRLWIDQIKSFAGFGTVVTGTILSGTLNLNDKIHILPDAIETRARMIEMHHDKADKAYAGQRVGINLYKVPFTKVKRGMLLSTPDIVHPTNFLNVTIRLLANLRKPIKIHQRVKIYLGTLVTNAAVIFMEQASLYPGETGFAQLRLNHAIPSLPGDTFVMGILNQNIVIGGGRVIQISSEKYRQKNATATLLYMKSIQKNDINAFVSLFFQFNSTRLITSDELIQDYAVSENAIENEIQKRVKSGEIILFKGKGVFNKKYYHQLKKQVPRIVRMIIADNPLKIRASFAEIKNRLSPQLDDAPFQKMISELLNEKKIIDSEGGFQIPNFKANLSNERESLITLLIRYAQISGFVPFSAHTFWKKHKLKYNINEVQRVLDYLHTQEKLIRLNNRRFLTPDAMSKIKEKVKQLIKSKGELKIDDCKEVLGYGRSVGIPVFEYLDSIKLTQRKNNSRVLVDLDIENQDDDN
jgi:selenocysteine-specific elongation factor